MQGPWKENFPSSAIACIAETQGCLNSIRFLETGYVGGRQIHGTFLDAHYITATNIQGTQKGIIILTTTHVNPIGAGCDGPSERKLPKLEARPSQESLHNCLPPSIPYGSKDPSDKVPLESL